MKNFTKCILVLSFLINASLICCQEPLTEISSGEKFQNFYPSLDAYEATPNNNVARFFLVRHGENEGNAKRLIDGRTLKPNLPPKS